MVKKRSGRLPVGQEFLYQFIMGRRCSDHLAVSIFSPASIIAMGSDAAISAASPKLFPPIRKESACTENFSFKASDGFYWAANSEFCFGKHDEASWPI